MFNYMTGLTQAIKPTTFRRAYVGPALNVACLLLIVISLASSGHLLIDAVLNGWIGAFTGELATLQWQLLTGGGGLIAGTAITHIEKRGNLPWSVAWTLIVVSLVGITMNPFSSMLLFGAVAILAVIRAYRDGASPTTNEEQLAE